MCSRATTSRRRKSSPPIPTCPDLPDHFHDIIAWKAIMKISGKDGAFADRLVAQGEYSTMYRQLVAEQTRPITLADSLA
jgi:hypothetical protein